MKRKGLILAGGAGTRLITIGLIRPRRVSADQWLKKASLCPALRLPLVSKANGW